MNPIAPHNPAISYAYLCLLARFISLFLRRIRAPLSNLLTAPLTSSRICALETLRTFFVDSVLSTPPARALLNSFMPILLCTSANCSKDTCAKPSRLLVE